MYENNSAFDENYEVDVGLDNNESIVEDGGRLLPPPEVEDDTSRDKTIFYSYKNNLFHRDDPDEDEAMIIDKGYREVISKLIRDNVKQSESVSYAESPQVIQGKDNVQAQASDTENLETELMPTGEKIEFRNYDYGTVKSFNNKHYYYSNRLRLYQYGILFFVMIIEIAACFYGIEVLHNDMEFSKITKMLYIIAIAAATIFPISAFAMSTSDYYKRKRINYSARGSILFSIAVTVLLCMIIFFINIYCGLLVGEISDYLSSLILPMVLSTNVIVNALVFNTLYKSGKFNLDN